MGAWDDYRPCCRVAAAHDRSAIFCPECGHPLLRCPAPDCGNLVAPLGHCPACVDIRLSLDKSAVLRAHPGECVTVPFVLRNNARVRSLSVKSVLRDLTDMPRESVPLAWDQLEAGRERAFAVAAGPFAHGGIASVRVTLIVAAVVDDLEETYAFSGDVPIEVECVQKAPVIDLTGTTFGTGGMVVVKSDAPVTGARRRQIDALGARTEVALERAERYEIEHGCRGYDRLAARIPRHVEFVYAGFPAGDRPSDGPLLPRPVIRCGRNGRTAHAPQNTDPNDLCLRIYDAGSGELDREASAGISRRVCDLVLRNDRLYVRSAGDAGLALNGERVDAGETRVVGNGDLLSVRAGRGRTLTLRATLKVSAGLVTQVRIEKK